MTLGKSKILGFIILLIIILTAPTVVQAGDGGDLPGTATEAVNLAALVLAAFGGLAASMVTDLLKQQLPWLSKENREKIGRWLTQGIAGLLGILIGLGLDYAAVYAADMDRTGIWKVVIIFGPPLFAEMRHRWRKSGQKPGAGFQQLTPVLEEVEEKLARWVD